jgi:hypothetical protein
MVMQSPCAGDAQGHLQLKPRLSEALSLSRSNLNFTESTQLKSRHDSEAGR